MYQRCKCFFAIYIYSGFFSVQFTRNVLNFPISITRLELIGTIIVIIATPLQFDLVLTQEKSIKLMGLLRMAGLGSDHPAATKTEVY